MHREPTDSFSSRWLDDASPDEPEAADLGTAFGLDISVLPLPDDMPTPERDEHPGGWLERMRLRKG